MTDPAVPTPQPPSAAARPANIPGIISLVFAIIAFIFAIIPFVSFIAWLPAIVAIVLGIVGLAIKDRSRPLAGIGLGVGILSLIVGIIVSIVSALGAVATGVSTAIEEDEQAAAEIVELTFDVTGTGTADVSYSYTIDGKETAQSADGTALPFTLTVDIPRGGTFDFNYYSLSASTGADASEVACKLTVDGEVLAEDSASGQYNFVSCTGSSADLDD
jgi:hypothetical protein